MGMVQTEPPPRTRTCLLNIGCKIVLVELPQELIAVSSQWSIGIRQRVCSVLYACHLSDEKVSETGRCQLMPMALPFACFMLQDSGDSIYPPKSSQPEEDEKDAIHSMYLPRMSDAKWLKTSIHWADLSAELFGASGMRNGAGESLLLASLNL